MTQLPSHLIDQILARYPLPIADAVAALAATDNLHERRDRVVETFRTVIRLLATLALASRLKVGMGQGPLSPTLQTLLLSLRRHKLTDGQWVALTRELLAPWVDNPAAHPTPELVALFHGDAKWKRTLDRLFAMRQKETIAHGPTGQVSELQEILERRIPELKHLLECLDPLFSRLTLVVPQAPMGDDVQKAWLWMGDTPSRARWRRIPLDGLPIQTPFEPLFIDFHQKSLLPLSPIAKAIRANPESPHECFVLDGSHRKAARYIAIPSMAEHRDGDIWKALSPLLLEDEGTDALEKTLPWERPFRGLQSFESEDAGLYFGREKLAETLSNRIRQMAWVTVTGASGTGKSSLLRAGVMPRLTDFDGVVIRPGPNPSQRLAHQLAAFLGDYAPPLEKWAKTPEALGPLLTQIHHQRRRRLLLVVDQAEELFTLCTDHRARLNFAHMLAAIAPASSQSGRVVLVMREDFFSRFATLTPIKSRFTESVSVLSVPTQDALLRTLIMPLTRFGYEFEDLELPQTMVTAVEGENSALPLLQFCADRMWDLRDRRSKRLTWESYRAIGGVEGALATHADQSFNQLSQPRQGVARRLLLRLVTTDGTRAVRDRHELLQAAGGGIQAEQVLDHFVAARLLTIHEGAQGLDGARVELTHEALYQNWQRLKSWQRADLDGQRLLEEMAKASRFWHERQRAAGLLWSGETLEDFLRWHRSADIHLSDGQRAFIDASRHTARKSVRTRRMALAISALTLLLVSIITMGLYLRAQRAESAATLRVSQLLRSASEREIREQNPAVGILLALEADKVAKRVAPAAQLPSLGSLWAATAMARGYYLADDLEDISQLAFDRKGDYLVAGDKTPKLMWHLENPAQVIPLTGTWDAPENAHLSLPLIHANKAHASQVIAPIEVAGESSGAFSVDLPTLQSPLKIHARATGAPLRVLAVDSNGRFMATAFADGAIWLWNLTSATLGAGACDLVSRNLTPTEWRQFFHDAPYEETCPGATSAPPKRAIFHIPDPGRPYRLWMDGQRMDMGENAAPIAASGGSHHFTLEVPPCAPEDRVAWAWPGGQVEVPFQRVLDPTTCPKSPSEAGGLSWVALPGGPLTYPQRLEGDMIPASLELEPFELLKTPVTVAQYQSCLDAGGCTPLSPKISAKFGCNIAFGDRLDHPMNCVSWPEAQAFCTWAGGSLPSDAQWEYAASGLGQGWPYPWGMEPASCATAILEEGGILGCGYERSWRVCSRPRGNSPQGLCDLVGNTFEWVADCRRPPTHPFEEMHAQGAPWRGPCQSDHYTLRGGAFDWGAGRSKNSQNHMFLAREGKGDFVGFRCSRPPTHP